MKIPSREQIRAADAITIERQKIQSHELMERAGQAVFDWLHEQLKGSPVKFHIFCGIGNNGGDGLVLARHLLEHGYGVDVYIVNYSDKRSADFLVNLDRLKDRKIWPEVLKEKSALPEIEEGAIVVDAIFGTGLNRKPDPWVCELIGHLSTGTVTVVSIDIPSGMFMDKSSGADHVIHANYVLTFHFPKLVFFLPGTGELCDHWIPLYIGLDDAFVQSLETEFEFVGAAEIRSLYRIRKKFTHKGTYGHALIIGGSYGKIGAVALSAKACLQSGSGLVSVLTPGCGYIPLQTSLPEVMALTCDNERELSHIEMPFTPSAIGIGMGMGTSEVSIGAFSRFLKQVNSPLVIDADGLNILAGKESLLKLLPPHTILTPHPGELRRLLGPWKDDFEKIKKAKAFAAKYRCVLLIKGAHTLVLDGDKGYVNSTGNPGMATGGSGDVLTGVITGLLAQGYSSMHAALMGVYLHGKAGDLALHVESVESLTASGIISHLGAAFGQLYQPENQEEEAENGQEATS
jgi:hydroxyethylthiazole kinase-like uncharacterized protein yjeF